MLLYLPYVSVLLRLLSNQLTWWGNKNNYDAWFAKEVFTLLYWPDF